MAESSTHDDKMPAAGRTSALSDLKNLFPTTAHFFIFVAYMALFICQGMKS